MTQYSEQLDAFLETIFPPQTLANVLGQVVADAGRSQLRMAETEKYPHVTYFLNGGEEKPYRGEDRIMVPSPKVATYDLKPEMSAPQLTDKAVEAINSHQYDLIVLNYANPDMVGHTGSLPAAIKAVEAVDTGLGRIADAIGLGCTSLSGLYGTSDDAAAIQFLQRAINLGVDFLDCRIIYVVVGFSSLTWVKNF